MANASYDGKNIRALIKTLPLMETEHMRRVGILVGVLSPIVREYSLSYKREDYDYDSFGEAAAYHDIGKVWVPKNILTKPSSFTKEEAAVMRQHPIYARKYFGRIRDGPEIGLSSNIIKHASDAAEYHHEWWNGKGYPNCIKSEEIPIVARITSVCDAYDAITSQRVYGVVRNHYEACCELEANAGSQFDPRIVRIFLNHANRICFIINYKFCETQE